jgi:hypothetical protein
MVRSSITAVTSAFVLCGALFLNSCQQTPSEPVTVPPVLLSARIDNQEWSVKGTSAVQAATDRVFYASLNGPNQQELFIIGIGGFTSGTSVVDRLSLYASGFNGVGTYALGAGSSGRYAVLTIVRGTAPASTLENYTTNESATGTLIITKYDAEAKTISGTFSFRGASVSTSVEVTQGQFTDAVIAQ